MTEMNLQILELINKNISLNELMELTGLSNKQLYHRLNLLKNQGFNIERKYYYNGDITYQLVNKIIDETPAILTTKDDTIFEALLISDLHISDELERIDLLNKAYEFCNKQGINIIINTGDLIDGLRGIGDKKFQSMEKQIEYLLKVYPYDKNILNFLCLGNHDYDTIENSGIDLSTIIQNKRHDIISLGYEIGKINIKNDTLVVTHPLSGPCRKHRKKLNDMFKNSLILCGHRHTMKCSFHSNNSFVYIPSLSDLKYDMYYTFPSAIKMTLTFENGFFHSGIFEHLLISDKVYKLSETKAYLANEKDTSADLGKNIDERNTTISKNKTKTLTSKNSKKQKSSCNSRYDID